MLGDFSGTDIIADCRAGRLCFGADGRYIPAAYQLRYRGGGDRRNDNRYPGDPDTACDGADACNTARTDAGNKGNAQTELNKSYGVGMIAARAVENQ